jgi:thioredoxin reductase (NADPH)
MHDLIIVGAGPAGLTAGLFAGRFRMDTIIFERMAPGGQIILSPTIENYPGFPGGISTYELIDRLKRQIEELGINIENKEAMEIRPNLQSAEAAYSIIAQDKTYEAKSVIVATGAQARRLGVDGEEKFIGRGVSYCATCDAPFFRNKEVVVIGGGDRAIEEAIFLSGYANKVFLVHRRSTLRASKILEEKARQNPKINFIWDSVLEEIAGKDKVEQVLIRNAKTDSQNKLTCQGVFIFVGIESNTAFLKNLLETDERGFIITDQEMRASRDGIFACGDCRKKSLYQVVTACSDGAVAADSAYKYLLNK